MELSIAQPRSLNEHVLYTFSSKLYGQVDGPESGAAVKPTTVPDNLDVCTLTDLLIRILITYSSLSYMARRTLSLKSMGEPRLGL